MEARALSAAVNNAGWCDLVCRSHGVPTSGGRGFWAAERRSPEFYPDAVTTGPQARVSEILAIVDGGPGCSVKDSFAALALDRFGFEQLFQASWIARGPASTWAGAAGHAAGWTVVAHGPELTEWAAAHGAGDTFHPDLLREPAVRVLAGRVDGAVRAGAVAYRTGSGAGASVGISNVFTGDLPGEAVWAGLVTAITRHFPDLPLVGYERGGDLEPALAAGFVVTGALRVWRRPD